MSAQMISHSRKRIIRFFNNHPWLTHISRNTRKFCSPNSQKKSEAWITREHMNTFCSWLRKHLMHNMDISEQLFLLARGPSWNILTYQGYEINGNKFYTIAQDKKSTNQNSGVRMDATLKRYGSWITVPISRCLYSVPMG